MGGESRDLAVVSKSRTPKDLNVTALLNIHNYFCRCQPPLSETAKQILEAIEERVLNQVKGNPTQPIQTSPEPTLNLTDLNQLRKEGMY